MGGSMNPPCIVGGFDDPVTIGDDISWTIGLNFGRELDDDESSVCEGQLREHLAAQLHVDISKINVGLFLTAHDASKRTTQAASYDAVTTISGAAQLVASALMAILFLALFI